MDIKQKQNDRPNGNGNRMLLRLRRGQGKPSRVQLIEPRRDHFRKTLYLAGAFSALAVCIYFFSHVNSVHATSAGASPAAAVQQ
jgi:hypothetical protein